jgi:hypothetical protein
LLNRRWFILLNKINIYIDGTLRLLDAIKNTNKEAIVHVCSSSEVFGRVAKEKLPINEECTFHPASPYAISKCGTDLVGRYYAEAFGINTQITRMFTHTGPRRGDVFAESSFAKQIAMIELGLIEPVVKVGNLNSLRTIADVRDAVRAYHLLVTENPIPGAYYNIGGSKILKIGEILEYLENTSRWVLPYPISIILVSLICFYIFCLSLQMSPIAAAVGAFAFTLFSFNIVSIFLSINSIRSLAFLRLKLSNSAYSLMNLSFCSANSILASSFAYSKF